MTLSVRQRILVCKYYNFISDENSVFSIILCFANHIFITVIYLNCPQSIGPIYIYIYILVIDTTSIVKDNGRT